jgi:hypothetical protein
MDNELTSVLVDQRGKDFVDHGFTVGAGGREKEKRVNNWIVFLSEPRLGERQE